MHSRVISLRFGEHIITYDNLVVVRHVDTHDTLDALRLQNQLCFPNHWSKRRNPPRNRKNIFMPLFALSTNKNLDVIKVFFRARSRHFLEDFYARRAQKKSTFSSTKLPTKNLQTHFWKREVGRAKSRLFYSSLDVFFCFQQKGFFFD